MTGGTVVILGETAVILQLECLGVYVYNTDKKFAARCNQSMVDLVRLNQKIFRRYLK